ncbi:UDP-2,3-diacylglucosamine diphosphatase [Shewanella rhizosphaerae]|uniref:UDP-2,3-diacylglucosamine diphosphatase n=1 Tax=Shewanella rhizosphaerae TaxID=2864207 RepID=UPI001C6553C9|nr:UDP-2,3-diacylglucosamine diphosphatase [Shewanella rhizosphaerae]QYK11693.1 UDP-2,3-diacylglucosamine diphosphatase [Shewanella rhizosphaerae]
MNYTLFVGDLHLSADRPDILNAFHQFLDQDANHCDALYILGDLFEVWVGDDIAEPFALELAERLKRFSTHTPIYFIHGNRDFLLGKEYAKRSGMKLLPEVYSIDLYGEPSVLLHGDSLCTLDKAYQRFRRFRNMAWAKFIYNHLPKSKRIAIADKLRSKSKQSNQLKSYSIMDVEQSAVEQLMAETGAKRMIHGHTHRPDIHRLANDTQRIVVGDWYEQGSVLKISPKEVNLQNLPFGETEA